MRKTKPKPAIGGWLTTRQVAEALGVTVQRAHVIAQTYNIATVDINKRFKMYSESDVKAVQRLKRPSGIHVPKPEDEEEENKKKARPKASAKKKAPVKKKKKPQSKVSPKKK